MNVLALNGSPMKCGNISILMGEICRGLKENRHSIEGFFLGDLSIRDCIGCMTCQSRGACVIRDDIEKVEQGIVKSDLIVIGTPVHWGNVSGIMLRVFESLFGFLIHERPHAFPVVRNAKGKKARATERDRMKAFKLGASI